MLTKKQKHKLRLERRVRRNPEKALLRDGEYLPQILFDFCVDECPETAFITEKLCNRLDRIQFELLCKQYYWALMAYKHVCARLTDAQFDEYIRIFAGSSLSSVHACARMSDSQFDYCIKVGSGTALSYNHSLERLNYEQFDFCVKRLPLGAIQMKEVCQRLTAVRFDDIFKGYLMPWMLPLPHIQDKLNPYQKACLNLRK